jgi:hypothetical protein
MLRSWFECVVFSILMFGCGDGSGGTRAPQRIPTRPSTAIGHQIGKSAGEFPFVVACGIMKHRGSFHHGKMESGFVLVASVLLLNVCRPGFK